MQVQPHLCSLYKLTSLGKLYWTYVDKPVKNVPRELFAFTTDKELVYTPFNRDFGPMDIGILTQYCRAIHDRLLDASSRNEVLVHFSCGDKQKRTNSACLALSYLVVVEGVSAESAWLILAPEVDIFDHYIDACELPHPFRLSILDVLRGLERGIKLGWYDYSTFDLHRYGHFRINGDLTWVIPNKFIAFAGPVEGGVDDDGITASAPEKYVSHFQDGKVTAVVRLNNNQYCSSKFVNAGFRHYDLTFNDGSCPPDHIRDNFLRIADSEPVLAVHCKAGLGRTGTLIGLHAMLRYKFPARAFIGWIRVCRPGSILGVQQPYLCAMEKYLIPEPGRIVSRAALPPPTDQDVGQGDRLQRIKVSRKNSEVRAFDV